MIYSVPHVTASGSLHRSWAFVPESRRLVISIPLGARDVMFSIEICSADRPVFGAVPIKRMGAEQWRVLPERYIRTWSGGIERLEPLSQPISNSLGFGDSIVLCNTPADVSALFEVL